MTVFKSAMKIALKNIGLIFMYIAIIILTISLIIKNSPASESNTYSASPMKISVVDEDNSVLSEALKNHLSTIHTIKECPNDSASLCENLYYRNTDFILRIPAGFGNDPINNSLLITEIPGSCTGFYLRNQIESFLQKIYLYQVSGQSESQSITLAKKTMSPPVNVIDQPIKNETSLSIFFQFIPYGAICMLSFVIGNVFCAFMNEKIRKRTGASALTPHRMEGELLLSIIIFSILIFFIFLLMGTFFYGKNFWTTKKLPLYIINMSIMIFVSTSLAYLIAMLSHNQESLSGLINAISLGMSFLCGIFVPLEILDNTVKSIAHFLPFYWYEKANLLISNTNNFSSIHIKQFSYYIIIQLLFALAFLTIGTTIHKKRYH